MSVYKECDGHEWVPCEGGICTSDLHSHHCKKCGVHYFMAL